MTKYAQKNNFAKDLEEPSGVVVPHDQDFNVAIYGQNFKTVDIHSGVWLISNFSDFMEKHYQKMRTHQLMQ